MATTFTGDLRMELVQTVRRIVGDRVAPRAAEIDRQGQFPEDIRRLFSEAGLLGLGIPEEFGGGGAPLEAIVDVVMEIAATCANSANIVTQQGLAAAPILLAGSPEQRARWLPTLASGEVLGSFALTEPGAGSDNHAISTTARRVGDQYLVEGDKVFCTWGSIAGLITIFAQAREDSDGEGLVALVTPAPAEGIEVVRLESKMGLNGSPTAQLRFSGLEIPVENRLGRSGEGFKIAMQSLNPGRVEIGALALGIARGALEFAGRHLVERHQFGQSLASFQGLRFKVADLATDIEAAYQLLISAARAVDRGERDQIRLSAMAKMFATDVAMRVTTDAVGLLGGYGYLHDYPVERMMRDAKVMQIVEGTNEIQKVVIAKEWFGSLGRAT